MATAKVTIDNQNIPTTKSNKVSAPELCPDPETAAAMPAKKTNKAKTDATSRTKAIT